MKRCLVLVLGLGLALTGCTGDDDGETTGPRAAIEGFETSLQEAFGPRARLNLALVADPEATREAALDLLGSQDPDVRIAAVYSLSVTAHPEDADALALLLDSADPGERVLAAAGMLAVGDARAVPVLIQSLGEDAALPFGYPAARCWEKARFALLQSTGQDLGLREAATAAKAAAVIPAWEAWWADAEATFEVVPASEPFEQ